MRRRPRHIGLDESQPADGSGSGRSCDVVHGEVIALQRDRDATALLTARLDSFMAGERTLAAA